MIDSPSQEAIWRAELEQEGENAVRDSYNHHGGIRTGGEPKLKFVRQWLREKEIAREKRESNIYSYVKLTLYAAIGAVIIGVIGVALTVIHL
jgi:preprotein translocase subunit Sss1